MAGGRGVERDLNALRLDASANNSDSIHTT